MQSRCLGSLFFKRGAENLLPGWIVIPSPVESAHAIIVEIGTV